MKTSYTETVADRGGEDVLALFLYLILNLLPV